MTFTNINGKGDLFMKKKILMVFIIMAICCQSIGCVIYADDNDDLDENLDEILETAATVNESEPKLSARTAIVYDRKSNKMIYGKQQDKRVAMASTTKIMTAIVVIENINLEKEVTVSAKAAAIGGSRLGLKKGDKITIRNLLYGLMLCSGNDAAVALAEEVGGSIEGFADKMNEKAKELNLQNTHFVTPHGLDNPEHYTTAYELAVLTNYAMNNEIFSKIVGTKNYTISINGYSKALSNTNELLGYLDGVKGVKTGFTNNAGRCLVTCVKRGEFEIITVVLGADTKKIRTEDSIKLIEYTYKNYKQVNIAPIIDEKYNEWKKMNMNRILIEKMSPSSNLGLDLDTIKNEIIPIKATEIDDIDIEVYCLFSLEAPVEKGRIIGNLKIKLKDEIIETINIAISEKIERKNKKEYFLEFLNVMS